MCYLYFTVRRILNKFLPMWNRKVSRSREQIQSHRSNLAGVTITVTKRKSAGNLLTTLIVCTSTILTPRVRIPCTPSTLILSIYIVEIGLSLIMEWEKAKRGQDWPLFKNVNNHPGNGIHSPCRHHWWPPPCRRRNGQFVRRTSCKACWSGLPP